MMPVWTSDLAKFAAGIVATLAAVWVARINRSGSLAETLRRQEESIRLYLKGELKRRDEETERLVARVRHLERREGQVRKLLRQALDLLAQGQPVDAQLAAILKTLDDGEAA